MLKKLISNEKYEVYTLREDYFITVYKVYSYKEKRKFYNLIIRFMGEYYTHKELSLIKLACLISDYKKAIKQAISQGNLYLDLEENN